MYNKFELVVSTKNISFKKTISEYDQLKTFVKNFCYVNQCSINDVVITVAGMRMTKENLEILKVEVNA
jgi:hypothetical protein